MIYVALLRGINVGGNNKIPMKELKKTNSGNVVFEDKAREKDELEINDGSECEHHPKDL